jgi:hypothetical protein
LTPPFLCSLFDSDGSVFYGVTFEDGEVRESVESHLVAACSNDNNNDNNDNKKVGQREVEGETVEQVIERRRSFRKQKRDKEKEDRDIQKNLER